MNRKSTFRSTLSRRAWIGGSFAAGSTGLLSNSASAATGAERGSPQPFRYSLNMSTIRGQELSFAEEIGVAGEAGYDAIEPWFRKIYADLESGTSLSELRQRIEDAGLTVESAIGFAPWIVDDEAQRAAGLEEAKRDMDTIAQLGGVRIAAPPAGTKEAVDLDRAAERYRALLELGDRMGVVPQVEMWGGHPAIGTIEKAVYIATAAGHPKACFLGDVYHTYKGGSSFDAFRLLSPAALQSVHLNDYPADPPRSEIADKDRVYPGDGVAPVVDLLVIFMEQGACPVLSLELFNPEYWARPALETARTGLDKMKACVARAEERFAENALHE